MAKCIAMMIVGVSLMVWSAYQEGYRKGRTITFTETTTGVEYVITLPVGAYTNDVNSLTLIRQGM